MISSNNVDRHSFMRRTMKFNLEYINTAISSVPHNQSDIRIAFGYTDMIDDEVRVVEYLGERQFFEVCRKTFRSTVYQSQWIPLHPQLLAVASNQIRIFDYRDRELRLRSSLLSEDSHNPVIGMDWNRRDSQIMLATREDGELSLMNMEYGRTLSEMMVRRESPEFQLSQLSFGVHFGTGTMENCIITISKNNKIVIFDDKFKPRYYYSCKNNGDILSIELAKHCENIVALRHPNKVCLYDIRNFNRELTTYSNFCDDEVPTCCCWSPYSPVLYIGTSEGGIIKWRLDHTRLIQKGTSIEGKPIPNIHAHESTIDLLFITSVDLPCAPYATCVEAYAS